MSLVRPLLATQIVHRAHVPLARCRYLASDVARQFPVPLQPIGPRTSAAVIAGGGEGVIAGANFWAITLRAKPGTAACAVRLNQDGLAVVQLRPDDPAALPIEVYMALDGVGSLHNSHLAAEAAACAMIDALNGAYRGGDLDTVGPLVRQGFSDANDAVLDRSEMLCEQYPDSSAEVWQLATTMTVAIMQGRRVQFFHAGDSIGAAAVLRTSGTQWVSQALLLTRPDLAEVVDADENCHVYGSSLTGERDWLECGDNRICNYLGMPEGLQVHATPHDGPADWRTIDGPMVAMLGSDGALGANIGTGNVVNARLSAANLERAMLSVLDPLVLVMQGGDERAALLTTLEEGSARMMLRNRPVNPDNVTLVMRRE